MQKYNIKVILGNIPKVEHPRIIKELENRGISRHNIYQWGNIKLSDKRSMPLDQAMDFIDVLNIDIHELYSLHSKHSTKPNQ